MWAVGLDILTRSHFSLNSASRPTVGSANWGDISNKNISHVTQSTQVLLFSLYCDINTTYKLPLAQLLNKAQWIICTWATFFASRNQILQIPTQFHIPWGSLMCWSVEVLIPFSGPTMVISDVDSDPVFRQNCICISVFSLILSNTILLDCSLDCILPDLLQARVRPSPGLCLDFAVSLQGQCWSLTWTLTHVYYNCKLGFYNVGLWFMLSKRSYQMFFNAIVILSLIRNANKVLLLFISCWN